MARLKAMATALTVLTLVAACGKDSGGPSGPSAGVTASVEVAPAQAALAAIGATVPLAVTVKDGRGATLSGKVASWSSSAATVATVNAAGLVTAVANGTATITATVDGKSGQATVTVAQQLARLVVSMGAGLKWRAGEGFTAVVVARDAADAPMDGFTGAVTIALANPRGATLLGVAQVTAVAGRASYTGIRVDKAATGYQLVASSGGVSSAPGTPFDIDPGAFSKLAFTTMPAASVEGNLRMPAVRVEARDDFDNSVPGTPVTMRLVNAPWQRTRLGGALVQSAPNGAATFPDLTVDRPGAGYRLEALSGNVTAQSTPFAVTLAFTSVTVGGTNAQGTGFSCGIATGGTFCWGVNVTGQLGSPRAALVETVPFLVEAPVAFVQVTAGTDHACGLTSAGEVWCWGDGTAGQLGNGALTSSPIPVKVNASGGTGGRVYTSIDAGHQHTCGLVASGVYCWGRNDLGQVGNGTTTTTPIPNRVNGSGVAPLDFVQVSAGPLTSCGATVANEAYCWGAAYSGALGDGQDVTHRTTPVKVVGSGALPLRFASVVAGGGSRSCATTTGLSPERVYCWGNNSGGYLGIGTVSPGSVLSATAISAPAGVPLLRLSMGTNTSCALDAGGAAWCWGRGVSGEIGNGLPADQQSPAAVTMPGGPFSMIAAGGVNACALRTGGGGVYCWGDAIGGSLGDGTSNSRSLPTRIVQ